MIIILRISCCRVTRFFQEVRDRCRSEEWAFDSYKNSKMRWSKSLKEGDMMTYKTEKGNCEIINNTREKYKMVAPTDDDLL